MAPYQAGGLASGLDTLSIVDQFVQLQQIPIKRIQARKATVQTQISKIGDIASKVSLLASSASTLGTSGVSSTTVTSTHTSFSASADPAAAAGQYTVQVDSIARNAKFRSGAFTSSSSTVGPGTLGFSVDGTAYSLTVDSGTTLAGLASQINGLGAPISASLINAGTGTYLNIETTQTGYVPGSTADSALTITDGAGLGLASVQTAQNAKVYIDGLAVERRTNTFSDAIDNVTITAKAAGTSETLVVANDTAAATKRIQGFVDLYSDLVDTIQTLTSNTPTNKGALAGDSTVRDLLSTLGRLTTTTVPGLSGGLSTLADIGVTHSKTGAVQFDSAKLVKALQADSANVNKFFSQADTGMSAIVKSLTDRATAAETGTLSIRKSGLTTISTNYDKQVERMNRSVEAYRKQLESQFTSMETTVSGLKKIGDYLTQQSKAASKSS